MVCTDALADQSFKTMLTIAGVVPYCNNPGSVARAIDSLRQQTYPLSEILLIDDGSTVLPEWLIQKEFIRVKRFKTTRGRGAVRAFAIEQAETDLILFCDATIALPNSFASMAVHWFADQLVAGVFGRVCQENAAHVVDRWRARHLFKERAAVSVSRQATLSTGGCLIRRTAVLEAGNFNSSLVHSEDAELGQRLLANGFDVIFDPALSAMCTVSNTLPQVLERYWRWHAGADNAISLKNYIKQIVYSLKVMVPQDLSEADFLSVPISLIVPHVQLWKSLREQRRQKLARLQ